MRRAFSSLLILCAPAIVGAQSGARQAGDAIGTWRVNVTSSTRGKPALAAMAADLQQIIAVFRREPMLAEPRGFTVLANAEVHQSGAGKMVAGSFSAILIRHTTNADGSIDTGGRGEGLSFDVSVNSIGCMFGDKSDLSDAEGTMYAAITPTTMHGLPMYRDNGCIVITKRTAPPTIPVTRERALRAAIRQFDGTPAVAAELQRELTQMSPADRAAQAILDLQSFVDYSLQGKVSRSLFAKSESATGIRLVAPNPAFYDRTRLGDVQAIIVGFACGGQHDSPFCAQYPGVFEQIRDNLDWSALAALVR
ncbi:MAG TPA: hypothetical protein VHB25_06220 [Gemmatimonadaceae bacterium]|nr:hypothetical protein [Gemmatimonadaceae bacterium]